MFSEIKACSLSAVFLLLPAIALAEDFHTNAQGVCPLAEVDQPAARFGLSDLESNQYTVSVPEVRLARDSGGFEDIAGAPVRFRDRIELIRRAERDSGMGLFRQRATQSGDRCGWMEIANARNLARLTPLRVVQLPGREGEMGPGGTPSRLDAQIVARASRDETGRLVAVPLFSAPDSGIGGQGAMRYRLDSPISFFSIASVLDFQPDRNPSVRTGCDDVRDETCFLLLGGVNAAGREDLLGWVRGSDVELWPSTLSMFFAQDQAAVPYFFEYCAALRQIPGQDPGLCPAHIPGTGSYTEVTGNNVPRFPIISVDRVESVSGTHFIYEVVAALNLCVEGSLRSECRDATGVLQRESARQSLVDQARNVDILFVIDGTDTMTDFFGSVVDAAIAFAQTVVRDNQLAPRFSAVVYGDYLTTDGRPNNVSFLRVADFGAVGDATNLNALRATAAIQAEIQDPQRTWLEAPFAATVRALDPLSVGWRRDAGLRLVVWISDIGNREPGRHETALGTLTEHVSIETVAEAVRRASSTGLTTVRLAAINVPAPPRLEQAVIDMHHQSFVGDYARLRTALPGQSFDLQIVQSNQSQQVRVAVTEALNAILTSVRTVERCATSDLDCDAIASDSGSLIGSERNTQESSLVSMRIGAELARELGLLVDDPEGLRDGEIVAVETVFVVQEAADPRFDYWLALRRRELEQLVNSMSNLCSALDLRDFGPDLEDSYVAVLEAATRREFDRNLSAKEFIETVLSVPREVFSEMLDVPIFQFYSALQADDTLADEFQGNVCVRTEMMRAVLRGNRISVDDFVWENRRARIRPGTTLEEFRWDWTGEGGGNQYFFFPLSMLP